MPLVVVGDRTYRIRTTTQRGRWTAYAERVDNGDRYGGDFAADGEAAVVGAVTRWLEWQYEHAAALEALRDAERAYHRSVAGHAFANPNDEPASHRARREALEQVERARARLDVIRARRPD